METPDGVMICVVGETGQDGEGFHHATQSSGQFKTCELFHLVFSGIFHIFSNRG